MPFISEEIFCNLQEEEETIMVSQWPVYRDDWNFAKEEQSTETIKEAVRSYPWRAFIHERSSQQEGNCLCSI